MESSEKREGVQLALQKGLLYDGIETAEQQLEVAGATVVGNIAQWNKCLLQELGQGLERGVPLEAANCVVCEQMIYCRYKYWAYRPARCRGGDCRKVDGPGHLPVGSVATASECP